MVLLCSFILVGHARAQEVIVARETKPEAPKQAAPPPEQTPSESATPEPEQPKPKSRKKSASAERVQQKWEPVLRPNALQLLK